MVKVKDVQRKLAIQIFVVASSPGNFFPQFFTERTFRKRILKWNFVNLVI
jgi:hypothetical protein